MRPLLPARRSVLAALAGVPLAVSGPAHAAPDGSLRRVLDAGVIRLGVQVDGTTAASISVDSVLQGYLPELGRRLAAGLGVRAEFVQVPRGEMLDLVLSGRCDLGLGGAIASTQAALRVLLSAPVMYFQLITLTSEAVMVRGPADLRGLRTVILEGRSFEVAIRQAGVEEASMATAPNWEQAVEAMTLGGFQAAIVPDHHATEMLRVAPHLARRFSLGEFLHCCHLRMGEHDLLRAVNILLYLLRLEGDLPELHQLFFGRGIPSRPIL